MKQKVAAPYIRISKEDQSNFSISGQQMQIQLWAERNNVALTDFFIDDGVSAGSFDRPDWIRLEKYMKRARPDYLIVMKFDRIIRNAYEGLGLLKRMEALNVRPVSVMEDYGIDRDDPYYFKHMATIFVDAEFERRRISDRTRFGMWSGKTQGRFLGPAPYGYDNARDQSGKPIIIINPVEAQVIRQMFQDYLLGLSHPAILGRARAAGFPTKGKEVVRRVLTNATYAGMIIVKEYRNNKGGMIKGLHDPIIDEGLFWQVYYRVMENTRPVTPKLFDEMLPLRGFLLCDNCSRPHTGARCKGKKKYYGYYWCNYCRGKNYSAAKADNDIITILSGLSLKPHLVNALHAEAQAQFNELTRDRASRVIQLEQEKSALQNKIARLDERYMDDKIPDDSYQRLGAEYRDRLRKIQSAHVLISRDQDEMMRLFSKNISHLTDLSNLYGRAPIEMKQPLMKAIFPGCLTTTINGYRTPLILDAFSVNASAVAGLLEVKKESDPDFLRDRPKGWLMGSELNTLLQVVDRITKSAA